MLVGAGAIRAEDPDGTPLYFWADGLPRGAAIVYPKDAGQVIQMAETPSVSK